MEYIIPEGIEGMDISKAPELIIKPSDTESLNELIYHIICKSIEDSPRSRGMGLFDPRAIEDLLTPEDLSMIEKGACEEEEISIDYWKGRAVKLCLERHGDYLSLSICYWNDRWDHVGKIKGGTPRSLSSMLEEVKNRMGTKTLKPISKNPPK